jgi:enoyl-[acyl-carrier protein] reductase III
MDGFNQWKGGVKRVGMKRKVLITGGTKGLGLATARMFADEGAELYLSYRSDEASALKAASQLEKHGASRCVTIACDLAEEGASDRLFDEVAKYSARLDVYVHNAAATAFKDLREIRSHHIDKTFNITVKSFILGVQRAAAMMPKAPEGGAIVSVSGMDTLKAVPRHGLLGAAKSALETLTAYYAHELAASGIRVNGVNPGFLRTESTQKYMGAAFEATTSAFAELVPLKREPQLAEVADVILFLASPRSSWIVGQTINVDGGLDFAMPRA